MAHSSNDRENMKTLEIKQSFLASAISDISTYIQLADTKVSIMMGAVVAILVGIAACYEPIGDVVNKITPRSWNGVLLSFFSVIGLISTILVFIFGIMTIGSHSCNIDYKSKWFLPKSCKEYSFAEFTRDIQGMNDTDIIINMAAELYKLNDINRQKMRSMKWTLYAFSVLLIVIACMAILLLVSVM